MRRSYRAAGTFSLSLSRLDIEKPPDDIHRWRRTNSIVTGLWLLAFVQNLDKMKEQGKLTWSTPYERTSYAHPAAPAYRDRRTRPGR